MCFPLVYYRFYSSKKIPTLLLLKRQTMAILTVNNIFKSYGPVKALQDVSFDVPSGSVFGILGPNGSGKTTLLGILMDVLKTNSGSYTFLGSSNPEENRKQIGTLLETPNFYHYLSGERNLRIQAEIKQKDPGDIERVLKIVNLYERKDSKFSTYSLGMKQRLAIAGCLLGDPNVLVFDEPTNGLDPEGIAEVRELIIELNRQGKTIILASHLLDEVEKVCTHVAILMKGKLLTVGHVDEVLINEDIIEIAGTDMAGIESIVSKMDLIHTPKRQNGHIELHFEQGKADPGTINKYFFDQGITLTHIRLKKRSLESRFFELTKKK
jgi:ABC-type multidrug transport system ATPase subunit